MKKCTMVVTGAVTALMLIGAGTMPIEAQPGPKKGCTGLTYRGEVESGVIPRQNYPIVGSIAPESPGEIARLRPGDRILQVNDKDTREVEQLFAGPPGTIFKLLIQRGTETLDVKLTTAYQMIALTKGPRKRNTDREVFVDALRRHRCAAPPGAAVQGRRLRGVRQDDGTDGDRAEQQC